MAIRMTGMVSGLDTDSIVKELVSAYSTKKEKYEKEQTKLGWKQEIWKSLNKEVNSFYKSAGNLRFDSGYNTKKTVLTVGTGSGKRQHRPTARRQPSVRAEMRLSEHRNCMCFLPRSPVI